MAGAHPWFANAVPLLLAALLLALAGAARFRNEVAALESRTKTQQPMRFAMRFCMADEVKLECDEESIIQVQSSFYNRRKDESCPPKRPEGAVEENCHPNSTEMVLKACEGKRQCLLPPTAHGYCGKEEPFTQVRIVWDCVMDSWFEEMEEELIPMKDFGVAQEEALEKSDEVDDDDVLDDPVSAKVNLVPEVPTKVDPVPEEPIIMPVARADAKRLRHAQQWCTSEPTTITCQDGETVEAYSAFYNRRLADCEPAKKTATLSCDPNAIDIVRKACSGGKQECTIPPSAQWYCEKAPYTFLRVVWDCVGGASPSGRHAHHGQLP